MFTNSLPPTVTLKVYIDDLGLQLVGPPESLVERGVVLVPRLVDAVETVAPVSRTKGKIIAADFLVASDTAMQLEDFGFEAMKCHELVGVDFAAGIRIRRTRQRARLTAAMARKPRFVRLKRLGGKLQGLVSSAVTASVEYGSAAIGIPGSMLNRLRSLVRCCTPTKAEGTSRTIDLLLGTNRHLDPSFRANKGILGMFAEGI